uniref:Delta(14)-sterol reductase ERG24 n=1 Tax=Eucampia antarctica TaxID=49252 RepID=A0A7S2SL17_9STRA|mmetsp:Transcript_9788/g.9446  ORF Transcript_9788/g.9446 Transcript_9788/m.9446 type:complete len:448 (+) Transcript_9788:60-1403(+)|eukprot:CAMPEP_0197837676 /NCGR_PEP_ID=MMETSP1437-20131217/32862_1 /TAXON_ID=49252 ORGANISM="Eucampia antarctica, Strain CCMP1452" /NCGR_SAMPLE_ID=MMETSP1437 /ASSEMBLY_ACC=CAM_ASM_001096 /LENGTH=447 /DNA_ID=CAMNT_0043444891 /DNA_START=60 /DNA_END=1403 /DNA_ORIENTATION=+
MTSASSSKNGENGAAKEEVYNPYKPPPPEEYEFGGPLGAGLTVISLPVVVSFLIHFACVGHVGELASFRPFPETMEVFGKCLVGISSWILFQALLERILPGDLVAGVELPDGSGRLFYRINGHLAFWVTWLVVLVGFPHYDQGNATWQLGFAPLHLLYDYYAELAFATTVICFGLSFYLYASSYIGKKKILVINSGSFWYDFWLGRELNPRILSFDLKEFCELRPGLIGWTLLNAAFAVVQKEKLGYVSGSMILVNLFQGFYVWDALFNERSILTTMDITTDGFGFMLAYGDLAWVPFTYSLQARYLVDHDPGLQFTSLTAILLLNILGYYIFRAANKQKDNFRRDPNSHALQHLSFLQTKRGTKLLTSGWWGMARKINYTGDWIMSLSWCLTCGVQSIVPYYYAIYFAILLIHRSMRDDHLCHGKYGDDWMEYKKIVPYRFIPGVV